MNPVVLNVIIDQKIPFISLDGLAEDSEKEYLISPYTKIKSLEDYCKGHYEYVGIAVDEQQRLEKERKGNKIFPLVEWNMTEDDCLQYCYDKGFNWEEDGVELYSILDRVSCWCCANKNLKELKNYYLYLPKYWQKLKELQDKTDRPMKYNKYSVYDLENKFKEDN